MMLLFLLLGPLDTGRLGNPDYRIREFESARWRLLGPVAWPWLRHAAATSPNPEVRFRARRLLMPARRWQDAVEAAAVLSPWSPLPDPDKLYLDHDLRRAVAELALANGVPDRVTRQLPPETYNWLQWWEAVGERDSVTQAVRESRAWLRREKWGDQAGK